MDNNYYELKTPQQLQNFEVYYHPYKTFKLNGTPCLQCELTINNEHYEVYMPSDEVTRYMTNTMENEVENE